MVGGRVQMRGILSTVAENGEGITKSDGINNVLDSRVLRASVKT